MPEEKGKIFTANFIFLCLATLASFSSFFFLLATLPVYILEMGSGETGIGIIIGAFATTALLVRPFAGRAADVKGRKILIVWGALGMGFSALLYIVATTMPLLLALRILHGISWAIFSTASSAFLADIVPTPRRGTAVGYYGMFISLAMAIGPATGVFLQRSFNFTVLFLSSSLIALCAFFTSLLLSEAASPLKGRAVLTKAPLVERSAIFPSLIIAILALTYASLVSFLPLFALNRGIENPGLFFTIYAIVVLLTRSFAGWISDRYGRATTIVPGMILASLALGILSHSSSLFMFLGVAFLFGLAFAAVQPALMALAIDRANPSARGAAMGTFTAAMDLGIGAGSFLWGFVAESFGFSNMYIAAGMVSLAGAIIFIWGSKGMMALPYPAPLGKDRETKG